MRKDRGRSLVIALVGTVVMFFVVNAFAQVGNRGYLVGGPKEDGEEKVIKTSPTVAIFNCPCKKVAKPAVKKVVEQKAPEPKVIEVEKVVEKPVEKIVYRDRIVEKPVEKIVYRDRIVEKPVEKIVYRDKEVEKITKESLNLKDVYFPWDSADFTPLALQTLKSNAKILKANPSVKVVLVGSASPEGDTAYNKKLSERRVNAVKDYLVTKENIATDRVETQVVGELQVSTKKEWPFARKVEFLIKE